MHTAIHSNLSSIGHKPTSCNTTSTQNARSLAAQPVAVAALNRKSASSATLAPVKPQDAEEKEDLVRQVSNDNASTNANSTAGPANPLQSITDITNQVQNMTEFAYTLVNSFAWPTSQSRTEAPSQPVQALPAPVGPSTSVRTVPDISGCLLPVPVWELKQIRKLCHLTSLTYKMHKVTPRAMRRKHALELVTTSWACELRVYEHSKSAEEIADEGDGMAVSFEEAKTNYSELLGRSKKSTSLALTTPQHAGAMSAIAMSNILPIDGVLNPDVVGSSDVQGDIKPPASSSSSVTTGAPHQNSTATPFSWGTPHASTSPVPADAKQLSANQTAIQPRRSWSSPAEMVAAMIVEHLQGLANAASQSVSPLASAAVTPLASAAGSLYAGLASLPIASALGASTFSAAPSVAASIMAQAYAAVSSNSTNTDAGKAGGSSSSSSNPTQMAAGLAAVAGPVAIAAAPGTSLRLAAPVPSSTGNPACPSEWFVLDDTATNIRYFVIQGSDTIDHWKLNLTFDPVSFEDGSLGIKVHRGAYEAAKILYDRFLPMVYEHLDSSPFAKVCFTGHSIGGSLCTLLAMMYVHRGVLPVSSMATLYTFGAPAVFCMDGDVSDQQHADHHHHNQHGRGVHEDDLFEDVDDDFSDDQHGHASSASSSHVNAHALKADNPHRIAHKPSVRRLVRHRLHHYSANGKHHHIKAHAHGQGNAPAAGITKAASRCRCGTGPGSVSPLEVVGIPDHMVRNVIMARDIVPRAFACDYALVADILKGWGPAFKNHGGLADERKHLYYFAGRMMVMQPDAWHWFAAPEPGHPMLPDGPDMYLVCPPGSDNNFSAVSAAHTAAHPLPPTPQPPPQPDPFKNVQRSVNQTQMSASASDTAAGQTGTNRSEAAGASTTTSAENPVENRTQAASIQTDVRGVDIETLAWQVRELERQQQALQHQRTVKVTPQQAATTSVASNPSSTLPAATSTAVTVRSGLTRAGSMEDVMWALMDNPHPLDMLADPGAYLEKGSISRYHNPDNYTAAIGRLIYMKRKSEGRIPTWVYNAYSRSLGMEAAAERGEDAAGADDLRPWDSSDGDTPTTMCVYPSVVPLHDQLVDGVPW